MPAHIMKNKNFKNIVLLMALSIGAILPNIAYAEESNQANDKQANEKTKEEVIDTKEKAKANLDAKEADLAKEEKI